MIYLNIYICLFRIILLKVPAERQRDAGPPVCSEREHDAGRRVHASSFDS